MAGLSLPASSADRWLRCPLSANGDAPEFATEQSDDAVEGVTAHSWAAALLSDPNAPEPDGVTDDMRYSVKSYVQMVRETAGSFHICVEGEYVALRVHPLNRCKIDAYVFDKDMDTVHVFEFKYGRTVVLPDNSWQLINYAVALLSNLNVTKETTFMLHVIQPRALDGIIGKASLWNIGDLYTAGDALTIAAATAEKTPTVAVPGTHCLYCPLTSVCKELGKTCDDFNAVTVSCQNLSDDDLSTTITDLRAMGKMIKARLDGLELDATHRIKKGIQIKDYTLASTVGHAKWTLPDEEVINMGSLFGVDISKPLSAITPAQAIMKFKSAQLDPDLFMGNFTHRVNGEAKLTYSKITKPKKV